MIVHLNLFLHLIQNMLQLANTLLSLNQTHIHILQFVLVHLFLAENPSELVLQFSIDVFLLLVEVLVG